MDDRFKHLLAFFRCKTDNELFVTWIHAKFFIAPSSIEEALEGKITYESDNNDFNYFSEDLISNLKNYKEVYGR